MSVPAGMVHEGRTIHALRSRFIAFRRVAVTVAWYYHPNGRPGLSLPAFVL
nr:hypothetical protein [uncultured Rhodopila sp.]